MADSDGLENRCPERDRGFESHPLRHHTISQLTKSWTKNLANQGKEKWWDSNGGIPPSWGDRSNATARGGEAP